ncbi:MAG: CoA pyrophosphatase [Gammaproteobacteria bacterium]|nr:CoA pyrophosphatase [Gammaproteobacteria bacterium]
MKPSIEQIRSRLSDLAPLVNAPSARRASVAIVLAGDSDARSVCFVERARREGDPWSGDVAFPGGWAKHEDESLREAAMRETREEIGLGLADAHHVGDVAPMRIPRFGSGFGIIGASVFYVGESRPSLRLEQREIAHAFWVPIAHLHHPDNRTVVHWARSGPPRARPAIAFDGRVIWGLTYRILVRFSNLVTDGRSPLEPDSD